MIKRYKVNQQIKISPIRLIDETGKNLGIVPLEEAVKMAIEKSLDLIEISATAKPPVCRLIDYKKFKYLQEKSERKSKKKGGESKSVRITFNASVHDLEIKAGNTDKFLSANNQIKIEMRLKGREKIHSDLAQAKFKNFLTIIKNKYRIVQDIKKMGHTISAVIVKG